MCWTAFLGINASSGERQSVIVVTATLHQGELFAASDLAVAHVAVSSNVSTIPAALAFELKGHRAAMTIPAGSLLTPADLADTSPLAPGMALVGVALKQDQLPAGGVSPGETVMVVQEPVAADPSLTPGVVVPSAQVVAVVPPSASSGSSYAALITIAIPASSAAQVATAAGSDQLAVIVLSSEGSGS